ncbi:hypothetical protein PSM36_2432 [Proteiniphilum saccharofermentans]|uniref:Uncharacterized protein n=1 Tax=Proteiniphilum saccharofermentans TaxID=1642647 RepID=A0A1R3TB85_9BACT|nr:hypothetical protein [Proteiniphilum saccharofermentans]SCD21235.1 hypothetical protein PSM36_2432 [Proteiniphilum saccharofermentans]SDZ85853.1 hypothetical protein SAMN05216331_10742 [Porphyromonadaceae bacterium KH3R12]SFT00684.1 hypothetical protein SAMN05216365_1419 [Porphyromonadaceae bacterium NLAE-zl-C104]
MKLTKDEKELIEVIRNYRNSRIFFNWTYEFYIRELFDNLLSKDYDPGEEKEREE